MEVLATVLVIGETVVTWSVTRANKWVVTASTPRRNKLWEQ